jgi:hypothetical protein
MPSEVIKHVNLKKNRVNLAKGYVIKMENAQQLTVECE